MNNEIIWDKKGLFLDEVKRYDEALTCFDKALKINPKAINSYINKANTLCNLKEFDNALKVINEAYNLNDNCRDIALVKVKILKK